MLPPWERSPEREERQPGDPEKLGQLQCRTISEHRDTGPVSSDPKKMLIGSGWLTAPWLRLK